MQRRRSTKSKKRTKDKVEVQHEKSTDVDGQVQHITIVNVGKDKKKKKSKTSNEELKLQAIVLNRAFHDLLKQPCNLGVRGIPTEVPKEIVNNLEQLVPWLQQAVAQLQANCQKGPNLTGWNGSTFGGEPLWTDVPGKSEMRAKQAKAEADAKQQETLAQKIADAKAEQEKQVDDLKKEQKDKEDKAKADAQEISGLRGQLQTLVNTHLGDEFMRTYGHGANSWDNFRNFAPVFVYATSTPSDAKNLINYVTSEAPKLRDMSGNLEYHRAVMQELINRAESQAAATGYTVTHKVVPRSSKEVRQDAQSDIPGGGGKVFQDSHDDNGVCIIS